MEPVLINQVTAAGIAEGRIAVVLRRWDAPRAKAGGTQRTPAGTIRIEHVAEHSGTYRVTRTPRPNWIDVRPLTRTSSP